MLLLQSQVQLTEPSPTPTASCALRSTVTFTLTFPAHRSRLRVAAQLLALCRGHLPRKLTPLHCPSELEFGKLQSMLTRLFLFLQGSRPNISSLFSLSDVLGHIYHREDKLLNAILISALFTHGQTGQPSTSDVWNKEMHPNTTAHQYSACSKRS